MLFFGHIFSEKSLLLDPRKVKALQNVTPPVNVSEVRSFLSSTAFCSRFIKNFAIITRPLRQLTCAGVKWKWTEEEQQSFQHLKSAVSSKTTLGYFDPKKPTIFVDGSPIGLGAVLTQENTTKEVTPNHYASCPLTPTQARYPQINREALSIYWAIKRFHLFVYGTDFKVITDHKPLVSLYIQQSIFKTICPNRTMASRSTAISLHSWVSPWCFKPSWLPLKKPSWWVSELWRWIWRTCCLYCKERHTKSHHLVRDRVSSRKRSNPPSSYVCSQIWLLVQSPAQCLTIWIASLLANKGTTYLHWNCSFEILSPVYTCNFARTSCHEGHLGIVKTKALLREKVWFPCMEKMVESKIKACLPCQIVFIQENRFKCLS